MATQTRETARRKALGLSYFTIAYNIAEAAVTIFAGAVAGSSALVGFGLDSGIESLSGGIMVWRFRQRGEFDQDEDDAREQLAIRLVGYTFFVLGAYVLYSSVAKLVAQEAPDPSLIGIIVAVISLMVMYPLARAKHRLGHQLNSRSLLADAVETLACMWLSSALLLGLGLNYLWRIWWADPVAGVVIAGFLFNEGREVLSGEELCSCGADAIEQYADEYLEEVESDENT